MPANADHLAYANDAPVLARVSRQVQDRRMTAAYALAWAGWWELLRAESAGVLDHAERRRRFAYRADQREAAPRDLAGHVLALREAGFCEVETVWQDHDDRVLAAVR